MTRCWWALLIWINALATVKLRGGHDCFASRIKVLKSLPKCSKLGTQNVCSFLYVVRVWRKKSKLVSRLVPSFLKSVKISSRLNTTHRRIFARGWKVFRTSGRGSKILWHSVGRDLKTLLSRTRSVLQLSVFLNYVMCTISGLLVIPWCIRFSARFRFFLIESSLGRKYCCSDSQFWLLAVCSRPQWTLAK